MMMVKIVDVLGEVLRKADRLIVAKLRVGVVVALFIAVAHLLDHFHFLVLWHGVCKELFTGKSLFFFLLLLLLLKN